MSDPHESRDRRARREPGDPSDGADHGPARTDVAAPPFPWVGFVGSLVLGGLLALAIGLVLFHLLADQTWSEAFGSGLICCAWAMFGVALGYAVVHMVRTSRAQRP